MTNAWHQSGPLWIFGAGGFGRAVAKACQGQGITVAGFVQTQPSQRELDGLPVRGWADLGAADKLQPLLLGIYNRDTPLDGLAQLAAQHGCQRIVWPWDLYARLSGSLGWRYWLADPAFLAAHADDCRRTASRLADDASRDCLARVIAFRQGLDASYGSFQHAEPQYFNPITLTGLADRPLAYVDGGAYVGDSLLALAAAHPVAQAWLFEPDAKNFERMVTTVRRHKLTATCLPMAIGDRNTLLRFSSGLGEAGHLDPDGDEGIACVKLDDLLAGQHIDFLKLDVEGAKDAALRGGAQTLRTSRPVVALSCYHHPHDLWALPDLLHELVPDYDLYLRQHTGNSFDLVLYGVPKEQRQ